MTTKAPKDLVVRQATLDDVDAIITLNQLAYPLPEESAVVWDRTRVESQLRAFPEGQVVAEGGRAEVAAVAGDIPHVAVLAGGNVVAVAAELGRVYAFEAVVGAVKPFAVGSFDG